MLSEIPLASSPSSSSSSYLPAILRPKAMLKLWAASGADQTTPKASAIDKNPFDAPRLNPAAVSNNNNNNPLPSSSIHHHHHLLNTHHAGQLTPLELGPLTPGAANNFAAVAAALPTTQLSLRPPEFKMKIPPPPRSLSQQTIRSDAASPSVPSTTPAKGQLHVKLIQARGLNVNSIQASPFVVVQFEQNEFVSREPTLETEKEVKGIPTNISRNGSATALSSLSAINIRKAFDGPSKPRATVTPSSSVSSAKSAFSALKASEPLPSTTRSPSRTASSNVLGGLSSHNPVWKHEVSL